MPLTLLAMMPFGRLIFTVNALAMVRLVNLVLGTG
jgi:hypothetical protein